ncbi:MAG TPA: bifunctional riboflavin kinase/FAD synthetase [Gaiellales bacterium]|nr:bifunctional riboflavin kinase/FAD synthetase [Gaiellales bacterium]
MIVRQSLLDVEPAPRAIAIGSFDGVHTGHRTVIGSAVDAGSRLGIRSAVVTFHPHPLEVLRPELAPPELSSLARKAALVEELGPDELVVIRFDTAFSQISADDFSDQVLHAALDARHVSVGENFRYGNRACGTTETLAAAGARLGFDVTVVPLLRAGDEPVSSSRIRGLLADGSVEEAAALLGRPPWLEGAVVRGDGRGRDLGFPTANLSPLPRTPLPATGIYAGSAHLPGSDHTAAISVGYNPTFTDSRDAVRIEAYLLDFDRDIYGSPIRLQLTHRLRDELRFESVAALVEQLHRDVVRVRELAG